MIKDILYKSDILDGLFTQKDFEFLKNTNSKQEDIEVELKLAEKKREKIIETIQQIDINGEKIKKINPNYLKEYVDTAESAFESVNSIIRNLNSTLDEFNNIEKSVLELVVKKDANRTMDTTEQVNKINNQIEEYKEKQNKVKTQNKKYLVIVDKFLNGTDFSEIAIEEEKNKKEIKSKIYNKIDVDIKDNLELRVSERHKRVYLPYTKSEIEELLENYPEDYKSAKDVVEQEYITDISIYNKHPVLARFRESYSLSRNKEMKSAIDSLKFAMDMMFRSDINPTIIAAVKSQKQLDKYIECLENQKLEDFTYFTIIFEVNPL